MKSITITIEGGIASGKTTLAGLLASWLAAAGHQVEYVDDEGGALVSMSADPKRIATLEPWTIGIRVASHPDYFDEVGRLPIGSVYCLHELAVLFRVDVETKSQEIRFGRRLNQVIDLEINGRLLVRTRRISGSRYSVKAAEKGAAK